MKLKKLPFALSVIAIAVFAFAVPASADAPVSWHRDPWTVDENWGSCSWVDPNYNFDLMRHAEGLNSGSLFSDRDGALVRILMEDRSMNFFYSSAKPDYTISGSSAINWYFYLEDGRWVVRYSGVSFNVSVEGEGTVIHESGNTLLDFDTWQLLRRVGNVTYDIPTLCRLLAG